MIQLHATTVSVAGHAALIRGAAGSGKSSLALQLMAHGARLIADDRTDIVVAGGRAVARCPAAILGRIEARGVGILNADPAPAAPVALVIDMDQVETERLPPTRTTEIAGLTLRLIHKVESQHFAPAILQYLKAYRETAE